ncbi:HigA family addiction module antitoxin [Methylobacterium mesophilicum]
MTKETHVNAVHQPANPCHPGLFVRRKVFEPRNLTIMEAAGLLGVTRHALTDFLTEKSPLTADLAFQIEKAFGYSMEMMMEMQKQFDIAAVRRRERNVRNDSMAKAWSQVAATRLQVAQTRAQTPERKHAFA